MKKLIATLAISLAFAVSANESNNLKYGKWITSTGKADPFDPRKWALAYNMAKENEDIHGGFAIRVECYSEDPDFLDGPSFFATYTNFMDTTYTDPYTYAFIHALFEGGKPRVMEIWHRPGADIWHIGEKDEKWLLKGLLENDRLYVRWIEYGANVVTAEFDLDGAKEAFYDAKRRCADD